MTPTAREHGRWGATIACVREAPDANSLAPAGSSLRSHPPAFGRIGTATGIPQAAFRRNAGEEIVRCRRWRRRPGPKPAARMPDSGPDRDEQVVLRSVRAPCRSRHTGTLRADPTTLTEVVVELVARDGPSLMTALSGQTPKQLSHSKQLPHERQRRASKSAFSRSAPPPPHRRSSVAGPARARDAECRGASE